mmetsp:Transcript_33020/g.70848  ORF Transcript_33020/g.70848 Transcript_33020/m.70848 type:complete len:217 (+) Transcript_33020:148-798(+)
MKTGVVVGFARPPPPRQGNKETEKRARFSSDLAFFVPRLGCFCCELCKSVGAAVPVPVPVAVAGTVARAVAGVEVAIVGVGLHEVAVDMERSLEGASNFRISPRLEKNVVTPSPFSSFSPFSLRSWPVSLLLASSLSWNRKSFLTDPDAADDAPPRFTEAKPRDPKLEFAATSLQGEPCWAVPNMSAAVLMEATTRLLPSIVRELRAVQAASAPSS